MRPLARGTELTKYPRPPTHSLQQTHCIMICNACLLQPTTINGQLCGPLDSSRRNKGGSELLLPARGAAELKELPAEIMHRGLEESNYIEYKQAYSNASESRIQTWPSPASSCPDQARFLRAL